MKETILRDGEIAIIIGGTQVIMNVDTAFTIFDKLVSRERQLEAGSKAMAKEAAAAAKQEPKGSAAPSLKNDINEEYLKVCSEIEALSGKIVFAIDIANLYGSADHSEKAEHYRDKVDMRYRLRISPVDRDRPYGYIAATEVYTCGLEASYSEDVDMGAISNITSTWHKAILTACMNDGADYQGAAWDKPNNTIEIPESIRLTRLGIDIANARWFVTKHSDNTPGGRLMYGKKHYRTFINGEDLRYIAMTNADKKAIIAIWKEQDSRMVLSLHDSKA